MCRISRFWEKCCPFWAIKQVRFALNVLVFSPEEGAKNSVLYIFLDVFTICMGAKSSVLDIFLDVFYHLYGFWKFDAMGALGESPEIPGMAGLGWAGLGWLVGEAR